MKVNNFSQGTADAMLVEKKNPSEQEMKKGAADFTAVFYEKMIKGMLTATLGEKGLQEDVWWEMVAREISRASTAPLTPLAAELYEKLKHSS
ncbi:MAG: hypothetical protein KGZ79_02435 [Dethiobacter sp.]|jgi:Rod binding domain-containing protein|nr:hypothetical protein [Dethiobacter sp.]